MVAHMAQCALADLIVDSQTEAEVLRHLEIETGGTPHLNPDEPHAKKPRVDKTHSKTAAALHHIKTKAMQRLASADNHIYITYYDIQHDIDIVLEWLNGHMHAMATATRGEPQNWRAAGEYQDYDAGIQNTASVLRLMGGALQGVQSEPSNREYWLQLVDVTSYLAAVEAGEAVAHPADVIAANRGVIYVIQSHLARERRLNKRYNLSYLLAGEPLKKPIQMNVGGMPGEYLHSKLVATQPTKSGERVLQMAWYHGGYVNGTMALEMRRKTFTRRQRTTRVTKAARRNTVDAAYMVPSMTGTGQCERRPR
ncbi:unnamed protein product [Symbiodinium sp. CCMP2592]|nr:unnamed protein product [Symbiodinium sp. CCMP2592]